MNLNEYKRRRVREIADELNRRYGPMPTIELSDFKKMLNKIMEFGSTEQQVDELSAVYAQMSVQAYHLAELQLQKEEVLGLVEEKDKHRAIRQYQEAPREQQIKLLTRSNLRKGPEFLDDETARLEHLLPLLRRSEAARYQERQRLGVSSWTGDPIYVASDDDGEFEPVEESASSSGVNWGAVLDTPPQSPPRSAVRQSGRMRRPVLRERKSNF